MNLRILVFGQSITQGFDDTELGGWVNRLFVAIGPRQRGDDPQIRNVFNLGISGDTTRGLRARFEVEFAARQQPNMVTIFDIGENDCIHSTETGENQVPFAEFSRHYAEMLEMARQHGPVFCLGFTETDPTAFSMPYYEGLDANETDKQKYEAEVQRLAKVYGATFISMSGLLANDYERLTYDGDHPSAEGHRLIFERVKAALVREGII